MFKKLEAKWNAHTPVYLHNRTKENIIFQLTLSAILLGGIIVYEEWEERKRWRKYTFEEPPLAEED